MTNIKRLLKFLRRVTLKGIYFNFKFFPFATAVKMPVLISRHVLFKNLSGTVILPEKVYPAMIQIGFGEVNLFDKRRSKSILEIKGTISFGGKANINHGSKLIVAKGGELNIGSNFILMAESGIVAYKKITFGDNNLISWETLIMDTDFHNIYDSATNKLINADRAVLFGDNVWICCRCTILKGTTVGNNAVIAAGTLLSGSLKQENAIFGGHPASLLREGIRWEG